MILLFFWSTNIVIPNISKLADLEPYIISLKSLQQLTSASPTKEIETAFGGTTGIKNIMDCIKADKRIALSHDLSIDNTGTPIGLIYCCEAIAILFTAAQLNNYSNIAISYYYRGEINKISFIIDPSYHVVSSIGIL